MVTISNATIVHLGSLLILMDSVSESKSPKTCHVLEEPLSPQVRCLGSTSSRSQGFTGGLSSP